MRVGATRIASIALALAVAATSCGGGGGGTAATTPATGPPATTTTTSTTTGFEVPATIDLAYAQRVLEALYHLEGELARHVHRTRTLDDEFEARLVALYGGQELEVAREEYAKDAALDFAGYADPPGDPLVRVLRVIDSSPTCLVAEAEVDRQPRYANALPEQPPAIIQLAVAEVGVHNPTGWGVLFAGSPEPARALEVCE